MVMSVPARQSRITGRHYDRRRMSIERLVVVGAGLAGTRAAVAARKAGFAGDLTVIGDEQHQPYTRPPLSKQLLAGEQDVERVLLPGRDQAEATWELGVAASGLDRARKAVQLEDGREIAYDRLILTPGSRARPWPGQPVPAGVLTLRSLDDALALRAVLEERPARLVVVGAGFVGSEVAATAATAGVPVTLVDVAPHPVTPFGPELGALVAERHRASGVDLRTGTGVDAFEADAEGRLRSVHLSDGTEIETRHALVALGALPNTDWLSGSGLELDAGALVCEATLTTTADPDVLAAGDPVLWPHPLAGGAAVRVEHWTTASEQGQAAGRNALLEPGEREPYVSPPFFWSDQYELKLQAAGVLQQAEQFELAEQDEERGARVYAGTRDGRLVAVVGVNAAALFGPYRQRLAAEV